MRATRPCKTFEGVRSRYDNVDLVIVRENTEDLYAGSSTRQERRRSA
jgi:isocitrate/isopropylmalate dehydrogenase